jgi:hypothetical protein
LRFWQNEPNLPGSGAARCFFAVLSANRRIRPRGITGWAQVNGGTLLTPSEKDALDEWYLRNACLWLDFRIILMTARVMIWGQRRPDDAPAQATTVRDEPAWPEVIRPEGIALEASMVPRPYMVRSVTPPRAPL